MKKLFTFVTLLIITLTYSQKTSQAEINKIIKEQSDGIYNNAVPATKTIYSDGKEAISTVYKDAKSLSPKIVKGINEIAKGLKIGAESVWNILVKQQKVWSICYLILEIFSIFSWFIFYKRNLKGNFEYDKVKVVNHKLLPTEGATEEYAKEYPRSYGEKYQRVEEEELQLVPNSTIPFFKYHLSICLVLSGFSAYHFGDMLTGFLNPEYGAMKDILFVALKLK